MLKLITSGVCAALMIGLLGCGGESANVKVQSTNDQKVNFQGIETYTWLESGGVVFDETGTWAPPDVDIAAELRFLIDREMRNRGYTEAQQADVFVAFYVVVDVKNAKEKYQERYSDLTEEQLSKLSRGAIVIELVSPDTDRAVWIGVAEGQVRQEGTVSTEQTKERLDAIVKEIFATLPS